MNTKLYRDAILDAKALRETAIANAKASLNELFEPKIQQMLKTKLMEGLEEDETMEESQVEEGFEASEEMNESELDEILKELESLEEYGDEHPVSTKDALSTKKESIVKEESEEGEESAEEGEEEEEESTEEEPASEDDAAMGDDTKVVELTLGDLKSVIQDIMNQPATAPEAMPGEDLEGGDLGMDDSDPLAGAGAEMGDDSEELSLDEILAELDAEEELEENKDEVKEAKGQVPGYGKVGGKGTTGYDSKVGGKGTTGYDKHVKQLKEANSTIKYLKSKLNEVNLLNAKLLYVNKIFKSKALNESQKVQILKAFDKISTVKEAQKTYNSIMENKLQPKTKKVIKESVGFASKPAGVSPKPIIQSDNAQIERWMKIAGIKK